MVTQDGIQAATRRVREAISRAYAEFFSRKTSCKTRIKELSPRFWVAIMDLKVVAESDEPEELCRDVCKAERQLGSPGDCGYGRQPGESLHELYESSNALWKLLNEAKKQSAAPELDRSGPMEAVR